MSQNSADNAIQIIAENKAQNETIENNSTEKLENNSENLQLTTPVTIIFGKKDAHVFDVSPEWTVDYFADIIAKQRGVAKEKLIFRYGKYLIIIITIFYIKIYSHDNLFT
jgi:hypothetical protein